MKLGLISDVHASPASLRDALRIFARESVDRIICPGDIAGYNDELSETIDLLIENDVDCIIGNHDQSWLASNPDLHETRDYRFLEGLPATIQFEHDGVGVYIVHAEPPDRQHDGIKLLDIESQLIPEQVAHWESRLSDFDPDILIVGHTHQVYAEKLGHPLVINPGSAPYNHSCMILELPSRSVQTFALEGKAITRVWNWGMQVRRS